jgi:hypothetical protein
VPLRVRANPAVPVSLVEPVLDPASDCLLWVGDGSRPSQSNVTYRAWSLPLKPEDWDWPEGSTADRAGTPRLPSPPPPAAPAAAGWRGRGQPQAGTDGKASRGIGGRLGLSLGPAGADAVLTVIASKEHCPGLLENSEATSVRVASQTLLLPMVVQITRPDPERRLALVADERGWRLEGGEPGTFYTFLRPSDGAILGKSIYVPQRTSEEPASDWGVDRQRLGLDTVVACAAGPGFDRGPLLVELVRTAVEVVARRAFSGTTNRLRQGALLIAHIENVTGSVAIAVAGLAPGEWATVRQQGSPSAGATADDPVLRAKARQASPVILRPGPVPVGAEVTVEIRREDTDHIWGIPVRILPPEVL